MKEGQQGTYSTVLYELAELELALQQQRHLMQGTAADINQRLQEQGVFAAYRQIHRDYVRLASFKQERYTRNEALKRAIFLNWYSQLEPAPFTALADLDDDLITEAYFVLNKILKKGWVTEEQDWMLRHYACWDWAILQYTENKIHTLSRWIVAARKMSAPLPAPAVLKSSMPRRGLMGLYFLEKTGQEPDDVPQLPAGRIG